jgi:hypothetical protein
MRADGTFVGSRFSRIVAPALGLLAVAVAVAFVLAAPHLLNKPPAQAAIPAPPAGSGQVSSVVAPALAPPGTSPGVTPSGSPAAPAATSPATSPTSPSSSTGGLRPVGPLTGGGISATPQPGVGVHPAVQAPPGDDDHSHGKKEHHAHHGHGEGHEHHGNGVGVGHSGDQTGDSEHKHGGKSNNGKHNGWTKPNKPSPPKASHDLGSGHGNGKKSDRGDAAPAKHGKPKKRGRPRARSRR